MGQVPETQNRAPVLIIGDGRMAQHMSHYFTFKNTPFAQWARSGDQNLHDFIEKHEWRAILLLIRDSALESFIEENPKLHPYPLIHFSGSMKLAGATGMHPLMTFGLSLYELDFYEKIPFVCEKGGISFSKIFPEFNNPTYFIDPDKKAFYHALCVMGGNFTTLLWQKLFQDFETQLGLPASAARPYLEQMTRNLIHDPQRALTGPLQRKDHVTIEKNLTALQGDPFQSIYQAFKEIYL